MFGPAEIKDLTPKGSHPAALPVLADQTVALQFGSGKRMVFDRNTRAATDVG